MEINQAFSASDPSVIALDWTTQVGDHDTTAHRFVKTTLSVGQTGQPVDILFDEPLIRVGGTLRLNVFGFVQATAIFEFVSETVDVDVNGDGLFEASKGDLDDAGLITLLLHITDFFVGDPNAGIGFELKSGSLGVAIVTPKDPADDRTYLAISSSLGGASLVGIEDLSIPANTLNLEINQVFSNKEPSPAALDWTTQVGRAHPDELRVRKASRETVGGWIEAHRVTDLPNVVFVAPNETLSSYELILKSKFVMIYNSTIGLEASIMGAAVLCAGKARFTQYPTVFFPQTAEEVRNRMKAFLEAEAINVPLEFVRNARRFLYYQLFRTSLPFGEFLEPSIRTSQTRLKAFGLDDINPRSSVALDAILDGLLHQGDFLLKE